ncbi:lytic transglycosylase domain-containing protein [Paraburkholderia caffeinilytica]|uniref:lytic transglycosylase domain-containing protein n=1 Tax=Paraburkholderia caffeinilytica TaxID=1761016 RepID=UPI0038BD3EBC
MSNKPVIEVDVNDQQFRAFYELFQQYSTQVEEMPDDWKKVSGATKDAGKFASDFAKYSDASKDALMLAAIQADAIGKSVGEAIKAQKEFASVARNGSSELEKMAKHAKTLGSEVFGIGKFLMKIGTIGFGLTGVGAILSGLGLRDLARSAISTQGEARSIGVSIGQLSAFETDFGRYVDPSILNRAADAQSDMRKIPYAMLATGQSLSAIQNQSPDELSLRMMQRAHDWYANTPVAARNAQTLRGTGLDQFMSFEEVRKLGAMTPQEFSEARANYRGDVKSFNVSDKSTDAWYGFEREIEAAGKLLKTDLTDRLAELAPNLREFVSGLSGDAKILIDDVLSPQNLKSVGDALHDFAGYLGSTQFRQDLKDIAGLIGGVASAIRKAAKFLGIDTSSNTSTSGSLDANEVQRETHGSVAGFTAAMNGNAAKYQALSPTFTDKLAGTVQKMSGEPSYFSAFEKSQGLPAGSLYAQEMVESRGKIGAVSPRGAMGPFQFMPDTAKQYGLDDPYNLHDSAAAAARMMGDLMRKYKGDIRKALAGYNWGAGNVDRDIAQNGNQWESHLPAETRNYLNKITSALAQKSTVNLKVDVKNSTSARVAVSTNASATGS